MVTSQGRLDLCMILRFLTLPAASFAHQTPQGVMSGLFYEKFACSQRNYDIRITLASVTNESCLLWAVKPLGLQEFSSIFYNHFFTLFTGIPDMIYSHLQLKQLLLVSRQL